MVVLADLSPAQAAKETLGLVRARAIMAVRIAVIDALGEVARVQLVPMFGFVGIDRAAGRDIGADGRHRSVFRLERY